MSKAIRVLTVGTGAVGSVYSWRLAQSCQVTTVCRSNYEAVRDNGFSMESAKFGRDIFRPHNVVSSVKEAVQHGPFDYILVTLKALPDVYNVAEVIAPAVSDKETAIVLIQNGLGVEAPLLERFPDNPLISIVAYIATLQDGPGRTRHLGGESLRMGILDAKSEPKAREFQDRFKRGGVSVEWTDNIEQTRWEKVFWNGGFGPVCAILRLDTTEVTRNEKARGMVKRLMVELMTAAELATGMDYEPEYRSEAMIENTARGHNHYKPSMQLDMERGNPLEVEVVLGTAMRSAARNGLVVPTIRTIYDLCRAMNIHFVNQ
ncbi:ketopantoate reductase PanE/ApbA-domain-containing protein [Zychaea mexicana]|uniref:ketopantoate reductase PanE/ApbA-domain-containing protein n=1 Tax=Zychaea mexicana TaxID=64656 RepID=UPI0022FF43FB|nr:ketopantoate reductase PanE/ApbA-domain-containing protein [Zychaea mexicana]KAI9491019.1 ketopantoate reductase PanE/ApbA-domain-containing protein [Zychaea mexicana]